MTSLVAAVFVLSGSLNYLQAVNQRLDHVLYAAHDPKLVVAGTIVDRVTSPDGGLEPRERSCRFHVERVVLGDRALEGQLLTVPVSRFSWPRTLVPFEPGSRCVLIMSPRSEGNELDTVVPADGTAGGTVLSPARDGEQVKRILVRDLFAVLARERSPGRQRMLVQQLAPILHADEALPLRRYLESRDPGVKRAALAALVYATEAQPYLAAAAADAQQFFATTRETDLTEGDEPGERRAAHRVFFDSYFFLEHRSWTFGSRWDEAEAERTLRVFRALLKQGILSEEVARIIDPDNAAAPARNALSPTPLLARLAGQPRMPAGTSRELGVSITNQGTAPVELNLFVMSLPQLALEVRDARGRVVNPESPPVPPAHMETVMLAPGAKRVFMFRLDAFSPRLPPGTYSVRLRDERARGAPFSFVLE